MNQLNKIAFIIAFVLLILWGQKNLQVQAWLPVFQSPIETPTPTPPFQTLTPTPGPTHTLTPTETPYPTRTPTDTPTPLTTYFQVTPIPGDTYTPTSTPTPTDTATPTPTATATPTPTPTYTPTPTHTPRPTPVPTPLPTAVPPPVSVSFGVPWLDKVTCHQTDWQQSGLWHISAQRSQSKDCAWWYGQETTGNYDTGSPNNGNLTSPHIVLPLEPMLKLRFATRWEVETARPDRDIMLVQIQGNDGTWQTLRQLKGEFVALRRVGLAAPLPAAEKWRTETVDISAYAGQTIRIGFRFDTVDAEENKFEGWWIDDIAIEIENPPLYLPETGGVNDKSQP